VQVTARVIPGRAASNCWQTVVFPPPEGAEIRINKALEICSDMGKCRMMNAE
jgi:hypothetical protein